MLAKALWALKGERPKSSDDVYWREEKGAGGQASNTCSVFSLSLSFLGHFCDEGGNLRKWKGACACDNM